MGVSAAPRDIDRRVTSETTDSEVSESTTMWCGTERGRERLRSESDGSVFEEEYRILVLGARGVGKTAVCQVYVAGREEEGSCERLVVQKTAKFRRAEYCTWDTVDGHTCCMRLSELRMPIVTSEEDNEDPILKSLTRMADGFLMIYSVIDTESFKATPSYYNLILEIRSHADTPLVFIGNKTDVTKRLITCSEGRDAAFDLGSSFYETSVKHEPHNVKHVFHDVIRQARSVRLYYSQHEQTCTRVRGLIHRLSLKNRRRRSKSRSKLKLCTSDDTASSQSQS